MSLKSIDSNRLVAIHSDEQNGFSFSHTEGSTLGAGEEVDEVTGSYLHNDKLTEAFTDGVVQNSIV